jgi:glycosyltransferase involved in cell wall biosynthesis
MLERKGVMDLVRAFQAAKCPELGLVLLGDGPELESYRRATQNQEGIFWEGYVQARDMGPYLAAADALVMPSHLEPWGLVVNEAMAAGVPVISTTCSGATTDLVSEGETGYSFTAGEVNQLTSLLASVANEPEKWRTMGRNAARQMRTCTPGEYSEAFMQAVRMAAEKAHRRR